MIKEGVANGRIYNQTPALLKQLSEKYHVGIDAVALRFIFDSIQPFVVLSGAFSKKQLIDNLKTLTFKLSQEELKELQNLKVNPNTYWNERKELNWN